MEKVDIGIVPIPKTFNYPFTPKADHHSRQNEWHKLESLFWH